MTTTDPKDACEKLEEVRQFLVASRATLKEDMRALDMLQLQALRDTLEAHKAAQRSLDGLNSLTPKQTERCGQRLYEIFVERVNDMYAKFATARRMIKGA